MSSTSTSGSTAPSARSRPRIAAFAGLSAALVALAIWRPSDHGIPVCGFRLSAGVACPGCGMTRAVAALVKGDAAASVKYHAFAPVVVLGGALAWLALALGLATGRNFIPDLNTRVTTIAVLTLVGLFIAYWLVRLWQGTAP